MNILGPRGKQIAGNIFVALILFSILRAGFFVFNYSTYARFGILPLTKEFLHGLRFDLSLILTVLLPYILWVFVIPSFLKKYRAIKILEYILFVFPLVFGAGLCFVDYVYFPVTGTRLTLVGSTVQTDLLRQIVVMARTYWGVPLGMAIVTFALIRVYRKYKYYPYSKFRYLTLFALLPLLILGIRGGTQGKVLHSAHAFENGDIELGVLALNTPFHLIHTRSSKPVVRYDFFKEKESDYLNSLVKPNCSDCPKASERENLVVIILESFSTEYTRAGRGKNSLTPFLDELSDRGAFFPNHYSSGKTSIEAIPSVLGGVPSMLSNAFIVSPYQSNRIEKLGESFSKRGYWTGFFHSGHKGTMFFDVAAKLVGIENYESYETYPNAEADKDGGWGIWDFKYFSYMSDTLSRLEKPFFASVFTLSSHDPYHIHPDFKDKYPKGELTIHESVGFADDALRMFFQKAAKTPWYENTLFVITADHTQANSVPEFAHPLGRFRVPLVFFHPKKDLKKYVVPNKVTSHVDVVPTLNEYFGFRENQKKKLLFGANILNKKIPGYVVVGGPSAFWSVDDQGDSCRFVPDTSDWMCVSLKKNPFYEIEKPKYSVGETKSKSELMKNYIQYFNEGAIQNSWMIEVSD